jgi:phage FluMu gp28-like protein
VETFLKHVAPVWTPHPGQRAFLLARAKTLVLACGRRWGKTEACAAKVVHALSIRHASRHLLVAPTLDQARILFERVLSLIDRLFDRNLPLWASRPVVRSSPHPRLEIDGHQVLARSGHVARALRGHEATHVVVDEAAYVDPTLVQDTLWPMLATTDGQMTLISTPNGRNVFWRFFQLGQRGEHGVWSRGAPTAENPRVPRAFLDAQRSLLPERTFAVEYEAHFAEVEGALFAEADLERCTSAAWDAPAGPWAIGVDFARERDFTVVAVLAGTSERASLVSLERFNQLGWTRQFGRVAAIAERFPSAHLVVDGTAMAGSMQHEELSRRLPRHRVTRFEFTPRSKEDLLGGLSRMVERGRLALPADATLLREMRAFRYQRGRLASDPEHDDTVIALALAVRALPSGLGGATLTASRRSQ